MASLFRGWRIDRRSRSRRPAIEPLERRLALSTNYVDFDFSNESGAVLDSQVWVWVTGKVSTALTAPTVPFQIDTSTGIATPITSSATTAIPPVTLADLAGKPIRFDAGTTIVGGRIYFTTSPYSTVADATSSATTTTGNATVGVQGISTGQVGAGNLFSGSLVTGPGIPTATTVLSVNSSSPPVQTTASFASGVNSFTVTSMSGLSAGMLVTGPGLANLTTVQAVVPGTTPGTGTVTLAVGVLTQSAKTDATLSFSQSSVVLLNAATASTSISAGVPSPVTLSFFNPAITIGLVDDVVQVTGGSATSAASYVYDFAEFAITPNSDSSTFTLIVDTTQVDQFGLPFRLQTTPLDPINPAGSGTISTVSRAEMFSDFATAMTEAEITPFLDCVVPGLSAGSPPLRILSPQDVIVQQAAKSKPLQTLVTSVGQLGGSRGAWTAQLTVPAGTAGRLLNGQGQLARTFFVFGSLLPAGTLVTAADASKNTITLQTASQATSNPFSTAAGQFVTIYTPPATGLNTWFGPAVNGTTNVNGGNAIDDFFAHWRARPGQLRLEVTGTSGPTVYSGTVTTIQQTSTAGTTATYAVLQMANVATGETYNIFYPYFTTNSPATKTDPFGNSVPAPPAWMFSGSYLSGGNESPSQMVFAADGVFANSKQAPEGPSAAYTGIPMALGSLENQSVTAMARGYGTSWQTVENAQPGQVSSDGTSVTYQLPVGTLSGQSPTTTLTIGMNVSSWKIFSVPMEITAIDVAKDTVTVRTPATFTNNTPVQDMLLFFDMYPGGERWSGYAKYLHNLMGYDVFIDGRAYALPYDDNGGFSTTLSSIYYPASPLDADGTTAARATVTLGNWTTRPAIDLNGDGIGDTIWRKTDTTGATVGYVGWIYDAAGNVVSKRGLAKGGEWVLETAAYFTTGPVTDFVWRNTSTNATVMWIMKADGSTAKQKYVGGKDSPEWQVETSGDYDGNGSTDLIWRNSTNDAHSMWLMNEWRVTSQGLIGGSSTFRLVATAADYDANDDGCIDLIWRNTTSDGYVVHLMQGTAQIGAFAVTDGTGWDLVATGNYDSNGIGDLLWREQATGAVVQWLMTYDATTGIGKPRKETQISNGTTRVPVQSVSYFGNTIAWRRPADGSFAVWKMLGSSVASKIPSIGGSVTLDLVRRHPRPTS